MYIQSVKPIITKSHANKADKHAKLPLLLLLLPLPPLLLLPTILLLLLQY